MSGPLRAGLPGVLQLPGLARWHLAAGRLVTEVATPPGWRYRLVRIGTASGTGAAPTVGTRRESRGHSPGVVDLHRPGHRELAVDVGRDVVTDGSFARGPWQTQVGNCDAVDGRNVGAAVTGNVLAGAGPAGELALRLRASTDSACESTTLRWPGGPLLLSMWVRNLGGAPPRICVWETARRHCAAGTAVLPDSSTWTHVQAVLTPNPAAGSLRLYAYADSLAPGQATVDEYAGIAAYPVRRVGPLALLATPDRTVLRDLRLADSSYTSAWSAPRGRHVLVDGMRNGWLPDAGGAPGGPVRFAPARLEREADLVSLGAALVACALAAMAVARATGRYRHAPIRSGPGQSVGAAP
ncbi:hypothetical protein GHK86_08630 [Acidimicrobiaceae bacterium USS-CC1]|uniref:LamG domain-containing protein n=1 Tax=Acidiferrimicrobium australe TaxID=2664430 RepID=A0ABW9QSG6_9ACTN|nr:hypothetical protein [Acidiferrimicrobium australe]